MSKEKLQAVTANSQTIIERMQNYQFALAMIEQLRGGLAIRTPFKKLTEIMDALLREIPYQAYQLNQDFYIFRGRIDNSIKSFNKANDFSYCPKSKSNYFGRCHSPGNTIFYGANNIDTVLSELTPEIGDTVHVGVAKVKMKSFVNITTIGEIDHLRRYNTPMFGPMSSADAINSFFKKYNDQQKLRAWLVDAFFTEIFSKPASKQRDYKITATLSELILEAKDTDKHLSLGGFAYPSVAHRGGMNFVIIPEVFDQHFEWKHFMTLKIADYLGFGLYGRTQTLKAEKEDNKQTIAWNKVDI